MTQIFFKENYLIALIRSETVTPSDFLANCGGLLGLFMGISVLSIVELFYYFTLRLCCMRRKQRQISASKRTCASAFQNQCKKQLETNVEKNK